MLNSWALCCPGMMLHLGGIPAKKSGPLAQLAEQLTLNQ